MAIFESIDDEVGEFHETVVTRLNGIVEERLHCILGISLLGTRKAFTSIGHVCVLGRHVVVIELHIFRAGGFRLGARIRTVVLEIKGDGLHKIFLGSFHFSFLLFGGNLLFIDEGDGDLDDHILSLTALSGGDHLGERLHDAESLVVEFLVTGAADHFDVSQGAVLEDLSLHRGGAGDFLVLEIDRILSRFGDVAAHCLVTTLESRESHGGCRRNVLTVGVSLHDSNTVLLTTLTIHITLIALRITHCETSH